MARALFTKSTAVGLADSASPNSKLRALFTNSTAVSLGLGGFRSFTTCLGGVRALFTKSTAVRLGGFTNTAVGSPHIGLGGVRVLFTLVGSFSRHIGLADLTSLGGVRAEGSPSRHIGLADMNAKRGIRGLAEEIQSEIFFNRVSEMAALDKLLRPKGSAAGLVVVTGAPASGKSALLREFTLRQWRGQYPGTSCLADLRNVGCLTPDGVAKLFKSSLLNVKGVKGTFSFGPAKADLEVRLRREMNQAEGMEELLRTLRSHGLAWRHVWKGGSEAGFPTIIIDEANRLHSWATDDTGRKNLEQLLAFFTMVTKQERLMNVVLASSENFFQRWIEGFIGPATVMNIGDLPEEEARAFLDKLIAPTVICDELWADIFHQLGGRMGHLLQVAGFTDEWDRVKDGLLATHRRELMKAFRPDAIEARKLGPPLWCKGDWALVVKAFKENEGVLTYDWLCDELSEIKVKSLIEYDFIHYRPYTTWGRDIVRPRNWYPLVLPASRLHLRVMEELV